MSEWIEIGEVDVDSHWKHVELRKSLVEPVVVTGALSNQQTKSAVV
jgi:hypothetical protein